MELANIWTINRIEPLSGDPLSGFDCTRHFLSLIAASGGGVLPQRGAPAAVLAPARRLPAPRHHRSRLQRRTPLRGPVNQA